MERNGVDKIRTYFTTYVERVDDAAVHEFRTPEHDGNIDRRIELRDQAAGVAGFAGASGPRHDGHELVRGLFLSAARSVGDLHIREKRCLESAFSEQLTVQRLTSVGRAPVLDAAKGRRR